MVLSAFAFAAALAVAPALSGDSVPSVPRHGRTIRTVHDAALGASTISVELQDGRHLVVFHRPRIELHGRVVQGTGPDSVQLVHRSQGPQVPSTNVLRLETADGRVLVATANTARSDVQVQTTDFYLTFVLARADLDPLLSADGGLLTVGGVRTRLKAKHFAGLRDWAGRISPPAAAGGQP
jgi:hypothetical protein